MSDYAQEPSSFADLLRQARQGAGLTQEQLAERAGLSVRGISDLERGARRVPQRATLDLLANALDLTDAERSAWERARRLAHRTERAQPSPTLHQSSAPVRLPVPLSTLIGREHDVSAVADWLRDPAIRLVTLTGIGGIGKTRLAIAAAHAVADRFRDGVHFISLATIRNPSHVVPHVARELGIRSTNTHVVEEELPKFLQDSQILLVLDNFEQVTEAAVQIVSLLEYAPDVSVLTTSRTRLRVRGEREYLVSPLGLPSVDCSSLDALLETTAGQLFTHRARDIAHVDIVATEDVAAIAWMTRRLDGLPLAIELATARLRVVSIATLAQLLEQRLPILTGGPSDLPARQRTMRDTIRWSYDLLTPQQQQLVRYLSIFTGGWTIESAAAVAASNPLVLLEDLTELIEQSLVFHVITASGSQRLGMLETVREFGMELLREHGEFPLVQQQHTAYYMMFAMEHGAAVLGDASGATLDRLDNDFDNMRAAFDWLVSMGSAQPALEMVAGLQWYWIRRASLSEAERWLTKALEIEGEAPDAVRAAALNMAGFVAGYRGDPARAQRFHQDALELFQSIGNQPGIGHALHGLAASAVQRQDLDAARHYSEASLVIFRQTDEWIGTAAAAFSLASVLEKLAERTQAIKYLHEALTLAREHGDAGFQSICLNRFGRLELDDGDLSKAERLIQESLTLNRSLRTGRQSIYGLELMALIRQRQGRKATAASLLGATMTQREQLGIPIPVAAEHQMWHEQQLIRAHDDLQTAELFESWSVGTHLSIGDAIDLALSEDL